MTTLATKKIERPEYSLPDEKTTPSESLQDFSVLLYGREKAGKTSLAAQFPDTFFMFCEPGGKSLSLFARPIRTWSDFKAYVLLLEGDKRYRTVVIDTIDNAYKYCETYVCRKLGIEHPSDAEWGKGWNEVRDEFSTVINRLLHTGRGVIFISHAREYDVKGKSGSNYTRISTTMSKQAQEIIAPVVDMWFYLEVGQNGERELVVRGDDVITAGHRLQHKLKNVDRVSMGKSAEEAYRNFIKAFENG